jgi:glycosyltransferase involved in cell wall biosynthesis
MDPLVSILIPAYNAEKWIGETLRSAVNQDYPRKEIILINDGSTDRTSDIAKAFASPAVKVINQANAGGPAARNTALAHAQGDYMQWLDHDDLLAPDKISAQLRQREKMQDDRVLFSGPFATFYFRPEKAKIFQSPLCRDLKPLEYFFIKFSGNTYFQSSCWLVSRKLTEMAGPWWDLRSPDDDGEYFCRVVAAAKEIHFVPEARCYWRVGNSGSFSETRKKSTTVQEAALKSMQRCIEHFLKLEDSRESRAACVKFLQFRMNLVYPENEAAMNQMQAMARGLGGVLSPPPLSWKYQWIQTLFGPHAARRARKFGPRLRTATERNWDKFMYGFSRAAQG